MDASKQDNSGIFGSSHKYFISNINSLLGHSLFEELRNDHIAIHTGETPHTFFGTVNLQEQSALPSQSFNILDSRLKPRTFKKQISQCDIFVLDLMSSSIDFEEAEYIIKLLKEEGKSQRPQILILVSTVMTWANTPRKLKPQQQVKKKVNDSDLEETKQSQEEKEADDKDNIIAFTDQDYQQRVPPPRYQQIKNLEMLAISAQKSNKSLRVHIACSGLIYGHGETLFYEFFRRAWLSLHQELAALPIIGVGKNKIPTIHVVDLARCIKLLIQSQGIKQPYLIAVDQAVRQSQKKILKAISAGMGSGAVKHLDLDEVVDEEWSDYMTLDLKMKQSLIFQNIEWHCPLGLNQQSMSMLNQEFNEYRGLFPLKLLVTGLPASGKTRVANILSQAYGVPHLKIQELVQMGYKLQDSFGEEIRKKAEEIKDQIVADYDKTKKKKDPELDRATIKVRLPDDIINKLFKMQMSTAACRNKGFILDGYPKTLNDAKNLFLTSVHTEMTEEQENSHSTPYPGYEPNADLIPQFIIQLNADELSLKQRVKELPHEKTVDTHFNEQGMDRRLKLHRENNEALQQFFQTFVPQMQTFNALSNEEENVQEMKEFIEEQGKPCCLNLITDKDIKFLKSIEKKRVQEKRQEHSNVDGSALHDQQQHQDHEDEDDEDEITKIIRNAEAESRRREEEERDRQAQAKLEAQQKKEKEEQEKIKLEQIRQQERDLLDTRSQPIRQYLMDNVVPHLTQGLIELCKKVPQEPGEYLANFLLKRADEIDQQRIQEREAALKAKMEAKLAKQQQHQQL